MQFAKLFHFFYKGYKPTQSLNASSLSMPVHQGLSNFNMNLIIDFLVNHQQSHYEIDISLLFYALEHSCALNNQLFKINTGVNDSKGVNF